MTREVNCMNCMIGRFKDDLCDEKMCEALKMIGESDDLVDIIMLAKELVRCKDCKHYRKVTKNYGICTERPNVITSQKADDFCSYGAYKGGGDE